MLKRWLEYWAPGDKSREAFEDVDRLIAHEVAKIIVSAKFGSADVALDIAHTLKKVPTAFILTESSTACIIYATAGDKTRWSKSMITLRSNTEGEVKICVL